MDGPVRVSVGLVWACSLGLVLVIFSEGLLCDGSFCDGVGLGVVAGDDVVGAGGHAPGGPVVVSVSDTVICGF